MIKKLLKKAIKALGYEIQAVNINQPSYLQYLRSTSEELDYFETPTGNYFLPNNAPGDIVINAMRNGLYFDKHILDVAERYITKGSTVLDVGANFGQMSVFFSKLTGASGKVYSFDADDYIYEIFKKNIVANRCSNIETVFGAVYNVNDKILLFPKQDELKLKQKAYGSYGLEPKAIEGREVKSLTIDRLQIKGPISFMKVDIQGSDLFALQGAKETIIKHKMPIIFEFEQELQNDFDTSFQDYVEFVEEISYKFYEVIDDRNYLIVPK
jgi:FkbM family methyltransferase